MYGFGYGSWQWRAPSSDVIYVAAANVAPSVSIASPVSGTVFVSGSAQTVSGSASDTDGTIDNVKIYLEGVLRGTATGTTSWTYALITDDTDANNSAQARTITAVATDNTGATTTSAGVSILCKTAVQAAIDGIKALGPKIFYYNAYTVDTGNAETGDQISQWTDLSGNGNHATQSTQDDQPTITSVGPEYRVTFDDTDGTNGDCLVMPAAVYANQNYLTQFSAYRRNSRTTGDSGPTHSTGGSAPGWAQYFSGTANDIQRIYAGAGYSTLGATWLNTDHLLCVRYDKDGVDSAARLKAYVDNSPVAMTNVVAIPDTGTGTVTTIQMARAGATSTPGAICIDLHIVFQAALSDTDRDTVNTHIKTLLSWYN
jgi:hypothetical protein